MIPHDFLDQLRGLNDTVRESKRAGLTERQREKCDARIGELRAKLPTALLSQHDRIARTGNESVAAVSGSSCGACHMRLPAGLLAELGQPGRIAVCPHCGVFVYKEKVEVGRVREETRPDISGAPRHG